MIAAHGGTLINRVLRGAALDEARKEAESLPRLPVDYDTGRDVQNIARGVFSPIEGFIGSADLASILESNRLMNGAAWTIPIMLDVPAQDTVAQGGKYLLVWENDPDRALALLDVAEVYAWDRQKAAEAVFGTGDEAHPGVAGYLKRTPVARRRSDRPHR